MNEKDSMILIKYIFKTMKLVDKGYKGGALVKKTDKLTGKIIRKIKDEVLKGEIKKLYEKCIKGYIKAVGIDDLELIKNEKKKEKY